MSSGRGFDSRQVHQKHISSLELERLKWRVGGMHTVTDLR